MRHVARTRAEDDLSESRATAALGLASLRLVAVVLVARLRPARPDMGVAAIAETLGVSAVAEVLPVVAHFDSSRLGVHSWRDCRELNYINILFI